MMVDALARGWKGAEELDRMHACLAGLVSSRLLCISPPDPRLVSSRLVLLCCCCMVGGLVLIEAYSALLAGWLAVSAKCVWCPLYFTAFGLAPFLILPLSLLAQGLREDDEGCEG